MGGSASRIMFITYAIITKSITQTSPLACHILFLITYDSISCVSETFRYELYNLVGNSIGLFIKNKCSSQFMAIPLNNFLKTLS